MKIVPFIFYIHITQNESTFTTTEIIKHSIMFERTFTDNCAVFSDTFVRLSRPINVPHLFTFNSFLLCRAYIDDINYNVIFRERNLLREKI